ncbi:DUF4232 domain-containing protein [Streptomyces sp. NPDC058308]|uniref:DUF4232 domain-containing protein n=1 Tax=Streptomyces sp. NPDC058308 TaxID=3346440 RepID=UPI0036E0F0E7
MRSRLASRSTRLLVTAVAATALTAAGTATALAIGGGQGDSRAVGQTCGTNDLTFELTEESQAGGYFLITAKAKPGITCYLEGTIPSAGFGSSADTQVPPAEQAVTDSIKLSGSTAAYAGINPKTTNGDYGTELRRLVLAIAGDEDSTVTLRLPSPTLIDKPISTNWHADPADAVPFSS